MCPVRGRGSKTARDGGQGEQRNMFFYKAMGSKTRSRFCIRVVELAAQRRDQ